jgi:hypothetical protein
MRAVGGDQSGTAILAVTVTGHRLEACAPFLACPVASQIRVLSKGAHLGGRGGLFEGHLHRPGLGLFIAPMEGVRRRHVPDRISCTGRTCRC